MATCRLNRRIHQTEKQIEIDSESDFESIDIIEWGDPDQILQHELNALCKPSCVGYKSENCKNGLVSTSMLKFRVYVYGNVKLPKNQSTCVRFALFMKTRLHEAN